MNNDKKLGTSKCFAEKLRVAFYGGAKKVTSNSNDMKM